MLPGGKIEKRIRASADMVVGIGEIGFGADHADLEPAAAPALADARVENGGLMSRVRAHDQKRVGLIDAGDTGIENIGGAAGFRVEAVAALDREIDRTVLRQKVLDREHFLDRGDIAGYGPAPLPVAAAGVCGDRA